MDSAASPFWKIQEMSYIPLTLGDPWGWMEFHIIFGGIRQDAEDQVTWEGQKDRLETEIIV